MKLPSLDRGRRRRRRRHFAAFASLKPQPIDSYAGADGWPRAPREHVAPADGCSAAVACRYRRAAFLRQNTRAHRSVYADDARGRVRVRPRGRRHGDVNVSQGYSRLLERLAVKL